jgi:hypothetical protein
MREQVAAINRALNTQTAQILSSFGHTGNYVLETQNSSLDTAKLTIENVLAARVVILPLSEIESLVAKIHTLEVPIPTPGIRATRGLVMLVEGTPLSGELTQTDRAKFMRISSHVVAAWKFDVLTDKGTLDRFQRRGGWGGLSYDVSKQLGGL